MRRWAFIFPGQGSQAVGMGKALAETFAVARETFEEAQEVLEYDLLRLCVEGPEEDLRQTEKTQPAVLAVSIAALRVLRAELPALQPAMCAGHSLGEWSALVCAGALEFGQALRLVQARGRFMQEAVAEGGAMAAVLKATEAQLEEACREGQTVGVCAVANINSPRQVVLSGERKALERALAWLKEERVVGKWLPVSAPFHCSLMEPAARRLRASLEEEEVATPTLPVLSNVDADVYGPGELVGRLCQQVTAPVRWSDSVRRMVDEGVECFVELGHGRVLSGLNRRICRDVPTLQMGRPEDLVGVQEAWDKGS